MKQALIYSLKVWLTAVLLSPVLIIAINFLQGDKSLFNSTAFILALIIGFLYSIPSEALFWLTVYLVSQKSITLSYKMAIYTIAGILLTWLAIILSNRGFDMHNDIIYWACVYSAVIVAGIWFYKLKPAGKSADLQPAGA